MPAISALLIGIMLVLMFIWYRSPGTERQFGRLENELASLLGRRRKRSERAEQLFLAKVFSFLQSNISDKNTAACYKAVDLLKATYGESITRPDEMSHLVGLSVMAMREKQYDITGILTDAAKQIVKRQNTDQVKGTLDQLQILATIALREKQNHIAAKALDMVFYMLAKPDWRSDTLIAVHALSVMRAAGILVIRRRDVAMLREIISRLEGWYELASSANDQEVARLMAAWLHRALYSNETAAFDLICEFILKINQRRSLTVETFELLAGEMKNLAGAMCLDPSSRVPAVLLMILLELGTSRDNIKDSKQVVRAAGEIARMAIHNHDLATSFATLKPLLEQGRKMLIMELKFGGEASDGGHRQHALFFIIKECLAVIEFAARKRMTENASDIAAELIKIWEAGAETVHTSKSFKKFCSLILLYHAATRRNRRPLSDLHSANLALFSDKEQDKLRAFIGGIQYELLSGTGRKV